MAIREEDFDGTEPRRLSGKQQQARPNGNGAEHDDDGFFTAKSLQSEVFQPLKSIAEGIVIEGATLLAGRPKIGKSWLALDLGLAVTIGGMFLGVYCKKGDVLYIALEDTKRRLQSRIKKILGPNTPWPEGFVARLKWPKPSAGGLDKLREWIASHEELRLVVIDVLAAFKDAPQGRKEDKYLSDYQSIKDLQVISSETHVSILIVHHTRKAAADDPGDTISGTLGLSGAADAWLVLAGTPTARTLVGQARDIEDVDLALRFDTDTCRWEALGKTAEVSRSRLKAAILGTLKSATEAMSPAAIADEIEQKQDTVRHRLRQMKDAGEVLRGKRKPFYAHIDNGRFLEARHEAPGSILKRDHGDPGSPRDPVVIRDSIIIGNHDESGDVRGVLHEIAGLKDSICENVGQKYGVIFADPPWSFKTWSEKGTGRSAERHYSVMSPDELRALPVADWALNDCALFMWIVDSNLEEALELIRAWGFVYKTGGFCWVKLNSKSGTPITGMGHHTRRGTEKVLLATRGNPKRLSAAVKEVGEFEEIVIRAKRGAHSWKPPEFYDRARELFTGPYLEMFARQSREGWDAWGNETTKFDRA